MNREVNLQAAEVQHKLHVRIEGHANRITMADINDGVVNFQAYLGVAWLIMHQKLSCLVVCYVLLHSRKGKHSNAG
jgi:hypothetical protein